VVATSNGGTLTIPQLLQLAGQARIIPVVTDGRGVVLDLGRSERCATTDQRHALNVRDRGCVFPGCTLPPDFCEAHHILAWILIGPTDLNNLAYLCPYHHHNFEKQGWYLFIQDGLPWWIPPTWKDPTQQPIRNTTHHQPITFTNAA
jgi:hypothetical protein